MSNLIQLLDRPIAYQPAFANLRVGKVRSGATAAILLSQFVYWHNRMDGEWFYKTQGDIKKETSLTRDEQETARKRLVSLGVLSEELRGVPATMHYRINADYLEELLLNSVDKNKKNAAAEKTRKRDVKNGALPQSGGKSGNDSVCGNPANKNGAMPQASLRQPNEQPCGDPANFHTGDYTEEYTEICQVPVEPDETSDPALLVLEYFNRVTNSGFRDSKSTMGHIRARLSEDYVAADLMLVADCMTAKWANDSAMRDYLRPSTVFGIEKFGEYYELSRKWVSDGRPAYAGGGWLKPGEVYVEIDATERDETYRRLFSSNFKPENRIQELAARHKTRIGLLNVSAAMAAWRSVWKQAAEQAAKEQEAA